MVRTIILCGGSGTRLWPLSTNDNPKQFLNLFGPNTLLEDTIKRVESVGEISLIANKRHLNKLNKKYEILLENYRRDTAPAILSSVLMCGENETIVILPSDHYIPNTQDFCDTIKNATPLIDDGYIVCFGIKPSYPETGYGYIKTDPENINKVLKFTEKPNIETARKFFQNPNYWWNAGILMFKRNSFIEEMKKYNPKMFDICSKSIRSKFGDKKIHELNEVFSTNSKISIDFALMEKSDKIKMMPSYFQWSDVGTWKSVHALSEHNELKNTPTVLGNSKNCYYKGNKKVLCIGLENVGIIETKDEILIMKLGKSDDLKKFLNSKKNKRNLK